MAGSTNRSGKGKGKGKGKDDGMRRVKGERKDSQKGTEPAADDGGKDKRRKMEQQTDQGQASGAMDAISSITLDGQRITTTTQLLALLHGSGDIMRPSGTSS